MAHMVFTDARVEVNSVDLSAHVKSVALPLSKQMQDDTAMGDTAVKNVPGLNEYSAQIEFHQDFAASAVDATIWPLYNAATLFVLKVRPTSGAISATNPEYSFSGYIASYTPMSGAAGDKLMAPIDISPGSDNLARATA